MADPRRDSAGRGSALGRTLHAAFGRGDPEFLQPRRGRESGVPAPRHRGAAILLHPGERVLWEGQPHGSILASADVVWLPVGGLWVAVSATLAALAAANGVFLMVAWGSALGAVGLHLAAVRLWHKARRRRATVYALTDRRVIERSGGASRSVPLADLAGLEVTSRGSHGSILFGPASPTARMYANVGLDFMARDAGGLPLAFYDIWDPQGVADKVEEAARAATGDARVSWPPRPSATQTRGTPTGLPLEPGEWALWVGAPLRARRLNPVDLVWVPLAVAWVLFSALFTAGLVASRAPVIYLVWGALWIAIGVSAVLYWLYLRSRAERETSYAVTNRRVLERRGDELRSISLRYLPGASVVGGRSPGSVSFGGGGPGASRLLTRAGTSIYARQLGVLPLTFYDIPDPEVPARIVGEAARWREERRLRARRDRDRSEATAT